MCGHTFGETRASVVLGAVRPDCRSNPRTSRTTLPVRRGKFMREIAEVAFQPDPREMVEVAAIPPPLIGV